MIWRKYFVSQGPSLQRQIQNLVKHLRWNNFRKQLIELAFVDGIWRKQLQMNKYKWIMTGLYELLVSFFLNFAKFSWQDIYFFPWITHKLYHYKFCKWPVVLWEEDKVYCHIFSTLTVWSFTEKTIQI